MHTQQHLSEREETQWRWDGAYTSTDAKGNKAHPSYALSANPRLQTHTSLEAEYSPPSSKLNAIKAHFVFYSISYKIQWRFWPILCADLGNKPVTDFNNLPADIDTSSHTHNQGITHALQEGLQEDKLKNPDYPQSIPDYVLHPQHKPKHHNPDLIRAVGYTLKTQGKLVKDLTYRGQR